MMYDFIQFYLLKNEFLYDKNKYYSTFLQELKISSFKFFDRKY